MKSKVVLFHPILEEGKDYNWPPVSLLALAAVLRINNIECRIIDQRVEKDFKNILIMELEDALCLGITAFTGYSLKRSLDVAKLCRKYYPGKPILFGGPHATALPEQSKNSWLIDRVITGYGEYEFLDKVQKIARGEMSDVPFDNSNLCNRLTSSEMPLLPYELINIKDYINPETEACMYLTSYGCPGVCSFCSTKTLKKWVPFSLIKVKKDLDNLFGLYPFRRLIIYDATFFVDIKRAIEIIKHVREYELEAVSSYARTYEAVRFGKDVIKLLENMKFRSLGIGLETGSPRLVDVFNKGKGHIERMYKIVNNFKDSSISIGSGIVFGIPGETIEDLKATLKVIKELAAIKSNFKISTTFFRPLPGTVLYQTLENEYKYSFPKSLEEWAQHGGKSHYKYNEFMEIPWFTRKMEKEYKKIYEEFYQENKSLMF